MSYRLCFRTSSSKKQICKTIEFAIIDEFLFFVLVREKQFSTVDILVFYLPAGGRYDRRTIVKQICAETTGRL